MRNIDDFLNVLNITNVYLSNGVEDNFSKKQLIYFAHPDYCPYRYNEFYIKKKNGENRLIHKPHPVLKEIHLVLKWLFSSFVDTHYLSTAFKNEKSIIDNAVLHVGYNYVYNIDLENFFHSFDRNKVKLGFMRGPFNFNGFREHLAFFLSSLCTHKTIVNDTERIVLPMGSPVSPVLSNILCLPLDKQLNGLARRFNVNYSRYADDITFSANRNIFKSDAFLTELNKIIESDQKFTINKDKVRLQYKNQRQVVTGLSVNEKINVNQKYIKSLRMYLYYWERWGYETANRNFKKDYLKDKGHIKDTNNNLNIVLKGKLDFLKMVKGDSDLTYQKMKIRFDKLSIKLNEDLQIYFR